MILSKNISCNGAYKIFNSLPCELRQAAELIELTATYTTCESARSALLREQFHEL